MNKPVVGHIRALRLKQLLLNKNYLGVEELQLLPSKQWHQKFHTYWDPSETNAIANTKGAALLEGGVDAFKKQFIWRDSL